MKEKEKGGKITLLLCIEKGTNIHSLLHTTPSNKVTTNPRCAPSTVMHVQKLFTPDVSSQPMEGWWVVVGGVEKKGPKITQVLSKLSFQTPGNEK